MLEDSFSQDGFIVSQRRITDIPYGRRPSSQNGCGWIAAYNVFKLCGQGRDPRSVAAALEKTLLFGGRFGTSLLPLSIYMLANRLPHIPAVGRAATKALAKKSYCGILLCRAKNYAHYVAYRNDGGSFTFYNSDIQSDSIDGFIAKLRPWLCISLNIKRRAAK